MIFTVSLREVRTSVCCWQFAEAKTEIHTGIRCAPDQAFSALSSRDQGSASMFRMHSRNKPGFQSTVSCPVHYFWCLHLFVVICLKRNAVVKEFTVEFCFICPTSAKQMSFSASAISFSIVTGLASAQL